MLKGVRHLAAVFLLEAVVFMSAAACWGGQWMTRAYGTTRPDLWEVYGDHQQVSMQVYHEGWSTLRPFNCFEGLEVKTNASFVLDTINTHRPRLVIVEYPKTSWPKLKGVDQTTNGGKQKLSKLREHY